MSDGEAAGEGRVEECLKSHLSKGTIRNKACQDVSIVGLIMTRMVYCG